MLRKADLSVPDGAGVGLLSFLRYGRHVERTPGVDLGEMLVNMAHEQRLRVLFVGGRNGSAISAAERLTKGRSNLQIYAVADNVEVTETGEIPDPKEERRVHDAIVQMKPAVVLVGLGAPKQEQWIARHRDAFPSVKVFVGVGGAFDIWSGRLRRAPRLMRTLGLEWFWRLILEPQRLPRILRAVVQFPVYALFSRRDEPVDAS